MEADGVRRRKIRPIRHDRLLIYQSRRIQVTEESKGREGKGREGKGRKEKGREGKGEAENKGRREKE